VNLLDIKSLTTIWGAKEAVFKIVNQKGISFKNHLFIDKFSFNNGQTNLLLKTEKETHNFLIFFKEIENFVLVYAFQNQ
jgi:phosphopantetheinyl transferase (holo-ACP synthase)